MVGEDFGRRRRVQRIHGKVMRGEVMKKEEILRTVSVVVLNYITCNETKEFAASLHKFYPGIRTIIVDNGSDEDIVERILTPGAATSTVSP